MQKRKTTGLRQNGLIRKKIIEQYLQTVTATAVHNARHTTPLLDMMQKYMEHKRETGNSPAFALQIKKTMRHLRLFKGADITLAEVDVDYCLAFIDYLKKVNTQHGHPLSQMTRVAYFRCFNCSLNWAVKKEMMPLNPVTRIDTDMKLQTPESTTEYLTRDELAMLISSPCKVDSVKRAYLFACFCGLRFSDITALTWENVFTDGDRKRLRIVMLKTRKTLYLPLSRAALQWLPERGEADASSHVFVLPSRVYVNLVLKRWVKQNGIEKKITFHTSRHTFATMSLQANVDLYTVSKLLGHTQVKTTQIYAKVIDRKKDEAVDALSMMFE